jgi:hypothetical protein
VWPGKRKPAWNIFKNQEEPMGDKSPKNKEKRKKKQAQKKAASQPAAPVSSTVPKK